jgi:hypothetical protein
MDAALVGACWHRCFNEEIRKERAGSEDTRLKRNRCLCKESLQFCLTGAANYSMTWDAHVSWREKYQSF